MPQFDRVDDNVSPVIVGSADWASAWAVDERGYPLFPVGRPGDRQREMAIRFGVNAVMYALHGQLQIRSGARPCRAPETGAVRR